MFASVILFQAVLKNLTNKTKLLQKHINRTAGADNYMDFGMFKFTFSSQLRSMLLPLSGMQCLLLHLQSPHPSQVICSKAKQPGTTPM